MSKLNTVLDESAVEIIERSEAVSQSIIGADFVYQNAFGKVKAHMVADDQCSQKTIELRFEIGRVVCTLQDSKAHGDESIKKLASDLTTSLRYTVHPQRLWECGRVYKTFAGDINKIWNLEKEKQLKITWSFLLNNCTKEPTQGEAAVSHYEKKIFKWEKAIEEIEEAKENKDAIMRKIPEEARKQIEGFFERVETQGIVIPRITDADPVSGGRLNTLFNRVDQLLTEIETIKTVEINTDTRKILEDIAAKINRILLAI